MKQREMRTREGATKGNFPGEIYLSVGLMTSDKLHPNSYVKNQGIRAKLRR